MITYRPFPNKLAQPATCVFLDHKLVGYIEKCDEGYFYQTKDYKHRGEIFATEAEVKQSLEGD